MNTKSLTPTLNNTKKQEKSGNSRLEESLEELKETMKNGFVQKDWIQFQ